MNSQDIAAKGFDVAVLRQCDAKMVKRRLLWTLIAILLATVCLGSVAHYFSRLPSDSVDTKRSFLSKARQGASQWWSSMAISLATPELDLSATKLPVIELHVQGNRLDVLTSNLPASGELYQSAMVKLDDKIEKAEVRFRGDAVNHWGYPSKSWRINLKNTKGWEGMQYLNLNMPRSASQMENWIGYTLATRMGGLLVPYAEFVQFRLNREYDGIRLLIEQVNEDFLLKRGLLQGKIYVGDYDINLRREGHESLSLFKIPTSEERPWTLLVGQLNPVTFAVPSPWEVRSTVLGEGVTPVELERLIAVINNSQTLNEKQKGLSELVDIEMVLNYMAFLDIVGSTHIDDLHNQRLFFNPVTGKFQPIVWDTIAYLQKNEGMDLAANRLFQAVLSIPEYRERKDQIIWKAIRGALSTKAISTLITQKADDIRNDVYAFKNKLQADDDGVRFVTNQEWEDAVKSTVARAKQRNDMLAKALASTRATYSLGALAQRKTPLTVTVSSRAGVALQSLTVAVTPVTARGTVLLKKFGSSSKGGTPLAPLTAQIVGGKAVFALTDHLLSQRSIGVLGADKVLPVSYTYEIQTPPSVAGIVEASIEASNGITGKATTVTRADVESASPITATTAEWSNEIRNEPRVVTLKGNQTILQDIILNEGENLVIEPGTVLTLGARVSIIVRGGAVSIRGTKERPIVFRRGDKDFPWGVLAVNGSKDVEIHYARFEGGSEKFARYVRYEGMLSIHDSTANISNIDYSGAYISAWNSALTVRDSVIHNFFERGIDAHFTTVTEERVTHDKQRPMHTARLVQGAPQGTASHIEREFKHMIKAGDMSLAEVGKRILHALQVDVEKTEKWNAPKYTGHNYYADTEVLGFGYRDLYFDTTDDVLVKNDVSYRLRNRFRSLKTHERHIREPHIPRFWPFRLEFQAKVGREHSEGGYSVVDEARFEFRKQSKPYNEENIPPNAPWDLEEFIPHFQSGEFKGMVTTSGAAAYKFLHPSVIKESEFYVEPRTIVITERLRQHVNIKSDWGSGPNPEQAFIISIDRSEMFYPSEYLGYVKNRMLGGEEKHLPKSHGAIIEIELEYERNVSDRLDKEIAAAEKKGDTATVARLTEARESFIKDQTVLLSVIKEHLELEGLPVLPSPNSKYIQSYNILYPRGRAMGEEAVPVSAEGTGQSQNSAD